LRQKAHSNVLMTWVRTTQG